MKFRQVPLLLVTLMLSVTTGIAQSVNAGDIRGTVTDSTGALLPSVAVSVLNNDTGSMKTFKTNESGIFDTNSLVPGHYTVTFSKDGFEQFVRGPLTIEVGFTTVNAQLRVGSTTERITVMTDVPLLVTENGEQTATLDAKTMSELPQVTQDWENFIILLPGATGTPGASGNNGNSSANPGQIAAINGNLPYNNILADGASSTLSHSSNANPATFENVAELQVNTSSFSAQYGIGGAIFNQISKGGTSTFHGTAYDFIQNNAFASSPWQDRSGGAAVPLLRYNDFGGTVDGPLPIKALRKRAFFYFNFDQIVNHSSYVSNLTVPTDELHGGDFTGMTTLYDPTTQTIATDASGKQYPVRQSFVEEYGSNKIPSTLMDTVAQAYVQFYPTTSNHISNGRYVTPTGTGQNGQPLNNFVSTVPSSYPWKKYFGRLDFDITPKNRLSMSDTQADNPGMAPNAASFCPIGCQAQDVDNNNAQITDVWTINSKFVNEARVGYTAQMNFFSDLALGKGYADKMGWKFGKADDFPSVGFADGDWSFAWVDPSTNAIYKEHVFDPADVVTLVTGKHILHFGGEVLMYQDNSTAWGNTTAGAVAFGSPYWGTKFDYTSHWALDASGNAYLDQSTGWAFADMLLGYVNYWSASVTPEYGGRLKSPQFFVQDDIKISPTLTVNVGVRYQMTHGWREVHGNVDSFDPNVVNTDGTKGAMWFGKTHANGRDALEANTSDTVLPRAGFAWLLNPKTTLRGGFGLYAYNMSLDGYGGGMGDPFGSSGNAMDSTYGVTPIVKLDGNGNEITPYTGTVSTTALPYTAASLSPARYNGQSVNSQPYHTPVPKIYQWNFSAQRQLANNLMAELSYVASHGFNLSFPANVNQIPQSEILSNKVNTSAIPYPNFNTINGNTYNAISNYHSLQAQISQRLASGLAFNFNYVWSHFLDEQDSAGWGGRMGTQTYQNSYNPRANYGNSNFDVRHAFKGNVVYQLPFGRGKAFLNHGTVMDEVVGGWQLSGSLVLQTGTPFSVTSNQNTYANGSGGPFPNWSGQAKYPSSRNHHTWYNPSAFTRPADGTFGNVSRNALYGPGLELVNLSAHKEFRLLQEWSHEFRLQFRADATNAFNHPNFAPPNTTLAGDSGAGTQYTTTGNGTGDQIQSVVLSNNNVQRNLQLALRLSF